jgi:DNA-binding transcriptional ArsR family regulator
MELNRELRQSAPVFAALGDETRLLLLARLARGEPLSITRLAEGTALTRQAVTKHLHVLADARLVEGARRGREQRWAMNARQLEHARRCLDTIGRQWERALERLKTAVEGEEEA